MGACEIPAWLDHAALDRLIGQWVDGQEDPDTWLWLRNALEGNEAELVFHEDEQGEWVGVRVLGMRLGRAHRSRVQRPGAN